MRALLSLAVIASVYLTWRWFLAQPKDAQVRIGAILLGLLLILMVALGRLPWVLALVGGLLPLLATLHRASRQGPGGRASEQGASGQRSVVESRYLRMSLDHDTGAMAGRVVEGRFAGQELRALSQDQLLELLNLYEEADAESAALLRAYLEREHGAEWQESPHGNRTAKAPNDQMTRSEAYAILGLGEGADSVQIKEAHRRLMQKLHPDRGGSTFLATKVNQAKDILLNDEPFDD